MAPEFKTDFAKLLDNLFKSEREKAQIRAEAANRLNDLAQEERTKDLGDLKSGNLSKEDLEKIAAKYPNVLQRVGSNGIKYGRDYGLPLFAGLVGAGTALAYPLVDSASRIVSRVYDTAERVALSGIDATAHVTGRALLPLALLGSVLVGAETYKPGTINRMVNEVPKIVQTVRQVGQQLYHGTSNTQSTSEYIAPLPSTNPKR